jgi:hypothetical protein
MMDDDQIEAVARGICTALGVDPDEQVGCGAYDDDTPAERKARFKDGVMSVPAIMLYMPRWRLYRWKAAEALAVQSALATAAPTP